VWVTRVLTNGLVPDAFEEALSDDERARLARLATPELRRVWGWTRAWLRHVLGLYAHAAPGDLRLETGQHGKPRIAARSREPDVRFNLSHSGDLAVVAVTSGTEVGVDLEAVRPRPGLDALVDDYCSHMEKERLRALEPARLLPAFLACWTRKEAYLKGLGTGLSADPASLTVSIPPDEPPRLIGAPAGPEHAAVWSLAALDLPEGYVGALALQAPRIRMRPFGPGRSG
jgi:4'-phosphopantetheinyl transferase